MPVDAGDAPEARGRQRAHTLVALTRRAFLDARTRSVAFAYVFVVYAYLQPAGYHSAYPTVAERAAFAHAFAGNAALRLFYGYPFDVLTVRGYSAWRVGGSLALVAAVFGVLAAVRALRTEEESGRAELVLAGAVGRAAVFQAATGALAGGAALLWLAEFVGFVFGGLPAAGSAYLALATVSVVPVFAGAGALASQLAPTRRGALALSSGFVVVCWLLRVVGDTWAGGGWLRWATPLGWAEELRPFTGPRPWVLVLLLGSSVLLLALSARIAARRDIGVGLLPTRESAPPRMGLLSSATALSLRSEAGTLLAWVLGVAAFSAILGMVSTSVSTAGISKNFQHDLAKLGVGSITTPSGYLAFVFVVFILALSLFSCSQIGACRQDESEQRLETLLAQPVGRHSWLGGRLLVGAATAGALSLLTGLVTWAGASSQGVNVSLPRMLEAGANCLPVALLFLGLSSLAFAVLPRASAGISYGLVGAAFLWYLVGSLLSVPRWLVDVTPFVHVGLVPAQAFRVVSAAVMVAIGVASVGVALTVFRRRDLMGA